VTFRFADCELDVARVVLRRDGREIKLEPQVFDVLSYLAQRSGEVVRKEELLDEIWGDEGGQTSVCGRLPSWCQWNPHPSCRGPLNVPRPR
jgi:DNA-binding winged helix-turn-helix (wHTH) protein